MVASAKTPLNRVTNFGTNLAGIRMYIDATSAAWTNAPIIVGLHDCNSTAQDYYLESDMVTKAKKKGAILIYPDSTHDGQCWDAGSEISLKRDGGGDPTSIVQMVNYTIKRYKADKDRVFILGTGSGATLGNVLAAIYPDVFAAASVYSGVAAGCLPLPDCERGLITRSPEQWGDIVRSYYPGYTGKYPRMEIWHGTSDDIVAYHNFGEQLKLWSNLIGSLFIHNITNHPRIGWTEMIYGKYRMVGMSAKGVGHAVPHHSKRTMDWFGLIKIRD
ncbi:hypothetical protein ACHAP5_007630 [Fusarium lateritium]